MNILKENMRRFGTKNLTEQVADPSKGGSEYLTPNKTSAILDLTPDLGKYLDPGHTYEKYSDGTVSKINKAGKTVATYSKTGDVWTWNEGNKQLSTRLGSIFDKAIQSAEIKSTTPEKTKSGTDVITPEKTKSGTNTTLNIKPVKLNWSSGSPVILQTSNDVLVYNKTTFAELDKLVDGFVDALDGDSSGMLGSMMPTSWSGIELADLQDLYNGILSLYKIKIRTADLVKDKYAKHLVDDKKEFVYLLAIVNSAYLEDEGVELITDLNKLISGELTGEDAEDEDTAPKYKELIAKIQKLIQYPAVKQSFIQTL